MPKAAIPTFKVTEEERACELMKKKIETALEDARGIIDFVEPSWDFTDE